jgi:SAM-dependent methyltransferase
MINLTIFSKNRASQLHLLLESIKKYAIDVFQNVDIIYCHTDENYKKGYEQLKQCNILKNVTWIKELNFRNEFLNSVEKLPYSCCLVDDAMFFRNITESEIQTIYQSLDDPNVLAFLLGVGKNISYCYTANCQAVQPQFTNHDGYITWNWREVQNNSEFKCPFMVVGNVYKREILSNYLNNIQTDQLFPIQGKLVACGEFSNPNSIEAALQLTYQYSNRGIEVKENELASWNQSCIVVHPMNLVQTVSSNQTCGMGFKELNNLYLQGKVIDLNAFDFTNIYSLHMEFNMTFNNTQKMDYQNMQKSYYDNPHLPIQSVIGNVAWHEQLPYEQYLLYENGDLSKPLFETTSDKVALDFACGPGRMIKRMSKLFSKVDGADISPRLLDIVKHEVANCDTYATSGCDLGHAPNNFYDFIYCTISIQHIASHSIRSEILSIMANCLNENGQITLQMAYHKDFYNEQHARYFEDKYDTQQTNSGCDVIINEKDLSDLVVDFNQYFQDTKYWMLDVATKYNELNETKHDDYWPSHWIFINAKKKN